MESKLSPSPPPCPPLQLPDVPASISLALERAKQSGDMVTLSMSRESARQLIENEDEQIIPKLQSMELEEEVNGKVVLSIEGKKDEEEKHSFTVAKTVSPSPLRRQSSFISSTPPQTVLAWKDLTVKAASKTNGPGSEHTLLENASGCITSGLWAVMGPSGCGKSTLLNALACRLDVNMKVGGQMRLNGKPYANAELKKIAGYVMQDDLLNPHLTVRETLHYTAALRLPRSMSSEEREDRVNEVIREMGLTHCQHVIVGDPAKKGVSGGERRRVCIGMELLTRPALLFMDEPTSGLDSVTALALGRLLHRLSRTRRCSVVVSIHQPQARLFSLFDRLILMKSGQCLFQGSIPACLQLFEDCGFPVPFYVNAADHILEVITAPLPLPLPASAGPSKEKENDQTTNDAVAVAARRTYEGRFIGKRGQAPFRLEMELAELHASHKAVTDHTAADDEQHLGKTLKMHQRKTLQRVNALEQRAKALSDELPINSPRSATGTETPLKLVKGEDIPADERNQAILLRKYQETAPVVDLKYGLSKPALYYSGDQSPSWRQQFLILLERNLYEQWRQRSKLAVAFVQQVIIGALIGTVFLFIGDGQSSVVRRQPVLQFVCINQGAFAAMSLVNAFPGERHLMLRERAAGSYHASAYFLAKTSIDSLIQIPNILAFSLTTYYLIGFQDVPSKFIIYFLFMILCNYAATSLALMISTLCKTTDLASVTLSLVLEICRLFGGFFLAPNNIPTYFSWLDALSYIKYSYIGISLNENAGLVLYCQPNELKNGVCPYPDGETKNVELGLNYISMTGCALVLTSYIIFVRFVAYLGLRFIKTN